jgi:hypothetical protein
MQRYHIYVSVAVSCRLGIKSARAGHTGEDCSQCTSGYYMSATGQCLPGVDPCVSQRCDVTADPRAACSNHGQCTADARCVCDDGFRGAACEEQTCRVGWTPQECNCCPSGVLDSTGACCEMGADNVRPLVDKDGQCCSRWLDACGVCGGQGAGYDSRGVCCKVCQPAIM